MAPAVPEPRELGVPPAGVVLDRQLPDLEVRLRGPDHHLGGELHPGRAQVECRQNIAPEGPHPAVRIGDPGVEEEVEHPGEHRVADVPVQPRHRTRLDVVHAIAHHQLGAAVQLGHEARDVAEVIRQVGVRHHDVVALGSRKAREVRAAVSAAGLVDDVGARCLGEPSAAVVGAVVDHDHLARQATAHEALVGVGHAALDRLGLVEAGDHHRHARFVPGARLERAGGACLLERAHGNG